MRNLIWLLLIAATMVQSHEAGFSRLDVKASGDVIVLEWTFEHLNMHDLTQADLRSLMSLALDDRTFLPTKVVPHLESNGDLRLSGSISTAPESFNTLALHGIDRLPYGHRVRMRFTGENGQIERMLSWRTATLEL